MRIIPATLALALMAGPAVAQHQHPAEHADIHERFYGTWDRPDMPGASCCNKQDCAPAEARAIGGVWYARHAGAGTWLKVPPEKIETRRDSPDGRNHLCHIGALVLCFLPAGGT
jgi:hypothetical protein